MNSDRIGAAYSALLRAHRLLGAHRPLGEAEGQYAGVARECIETAMGALCMMGALDLVRAGD